ncbi:redoxin domain-containing protein [Rossellomorea marisflavi]|uniref:redoxin domain-containing protein n=1 Tax=Rossellomorea marisflavi TaxID=189381 RepID=UPI00345948C6
MKKNLLAGGIILVALVIIGVNIWKGTPPAQKDEAGDSTSVDTPVQQVDSGVEEGKLAPDFTLTTLEGEKVNLSDYRGKKVLLNFWATWCPPCKAEMPHMQEFYELNEDGAIEILAVNLTSVDKGDKKIQEFVDDYGLTFPIPLDEGGDISELYQAYSIPTSYIIDSKGIISKKIIGPMDGEMMNSLMEAVD